MEEGRKGECLAANAARTSGEVLGQGCGREGGGAERKPPVAYAARTWRGGFGGMLLAAWIGSVLALLR